MAEWLRRLTRNQMGSTRVGSNPTRSDLQFSVENLSKLNIYKLHILLKYILFVIVYYTTLTLFRLSFSGDKSTRQRPLSTQSKIYHDHMRKLKFSTRVDYPACFKTIYISVFSHHEIWLGRNISLAT